MEWRKALKQESIEKRDRYVIGINTPETTLTFLKQTLEEVKCKMKEMCNETKCAIKVMFNTK